MVNNNLSFDECKQMSRRLIAMNPNRNANMGKISTHLLDYYTELTKQPWLSTLVGQIRDLTAKQLDKQISVLKKQLPFRSPHYFHFLDDHRAQKTIDPEAFTFQTTVDIDNPEEVETAVKNALLLNGMFDDAEEKLFREKIFSADEIELWKGKVLHVERSARNKAHIDIRIPVGMTIAEAQSAFCKLIHATEDPSCVTPERISGYRRPSAGCRFCPGKSIPESIFISEFLFSEFLFSELFFLCSNRRFPAYRERGGEGETKCQCRAV